MKTKLLYHTNSFTYECTAKVVAVEGDEIALDATIFYPGGGGQMPDRGMITWNDRQEQASVIALGKRRDVVWHTLDCPPPSIRTEITTTIDWDFRYKMMRTHTALHILCGVIWKEFGAQVTSGQMYPDRARIDVAIENLDKEQVASIERLANEAIQTDYPIHVYALPREKAFALPDLLRTKGWGQTPLLQIPPEVEEVRIVEIVGLDLQADVGTHVNHTREVGGIMITKTENKGRINKRIEIVLTD